MNFTHLHYELHVTDLEAARHFYVDRLGLPVLQDTPAMKLLAVLAGGSRISIFGNRADASEAGPSQLILAVASIEQAVLDLGARGIEVSGPPVTAGAFLRFVTIKDPDGNVIGISEYLRDPVLPV